MKWKGTRVVFSKFPRRHQNSFVHLLFRKHNSNHLDRPIIILRRREIVFSQYLNSVPLVSLMKTRPTPLTPKMSPDTLPLTASGRENGIGAAIAVALVRNGAAVTINHVSNSSASRAKTIAKKIREEGGRT